MPSIKSAAKAGSSAAIQVHELMVGTPGLIAARQELGDKCQGRRSHYAIVRENSRLLVGDAEVGEFMLRGLADADSLSLVESFRFTFLMANFVNNAELGFHENELGVIDDWEMHRAARATVRLLRSPGGVRFWRQHGDNYRGPFVDYVEELDLSEG